VTESIMKTDAVDLQAYQPPDVSTAEKKHASLGVRGHERHKSKRPMSEGVHRSVC
jgi:glutamate decarboxylase